MRYRSEQELKNERIAREVENSSRAALFSTETWAVVSIVYGVALCVGGHTRWVGDAYYALNRLPGAPYTWGALFIVGGILTRIGCATSHFGVRDTGMWLLVATCLAAAGGFAYAAYELPTAPVGPSILIAAVGLNIMVLIRIRGKRPPK